MTDQAARPEPQRDPVADFIGTTAAIVALAVRALWRLRLELAAASLITVFWLAAASLPDPVMFCAFALVAAVGKALWPWAGPMFARARARRAWLKATDGLDLTIGRQAFGLRPAVRVVPAGEILDVRVGRGMTVDALEKLAPQLRDRMRVDDVTIERVTGGKARVTVRRRDPFYGTESVRWPYENADRLSMWDPMPFGVDEYGEPVPLRLVERNILIGGEPGGGKSVALSLITATAALDPDCRLWLLDGKDVELAAWAPCAERFVGPDHDAAIRALEDLRREMDARYRALKAEGIRKVRKDPSLPLHVVVIDELAWFVQDPDSKRGKRFKELLRDAVSRGRAAGVIICAATQKPSADVIPSAIRDLMAFRLAMRCTTPQASDTVLGQGWAYNDADASTIQGGQRGVGYLLAEGEKPTRLRTYYLDDDALYAIAARAAALRIDQDPDDPRNVAPAEQETPPARPAPPTEDTPQPLPDPASDETARTRRVLAVLPDDETQAMSVRRIEDAHGKWPGLADELERLRASGVLGSKRGPGRGGVPVYWRKADGYGNSDSGSP